MYIVRNAMKNLIRNKGRNILIAAVTLAIVISTVVTLTINNAVAKVIDQIRLDLGSRVEIGQDLIEMKQAGFDGRTDASYLSIDNFYSFAQSNYLREVIYSAEMYAWSGTFFAVADESKGTATRQNDDGSVFLADTLKLISSSKPEALTDFGSKREIINGRMFENLNECVISQDIAQLNGVSVGDTIEFRGAYADQKVFSLTVAGIYSDATDEYVSAWMTMFGSFHSENRRNEIITSWDTLMAAGWESNFGLKLTTTYFLKDPDDISAFEAEVRGKGLPITYDVSINQDAYNKVTGPLSGMKSAAVTFMVVILILGAIVLALLSFMAVRERKYEVGVLRAMGMERGAVAFGILSEAVMISFVCLILGLGAGSAMAQPVADNMLTSRVAAAEAESSSGGGGKVLMSGGQVSTSDNAAGYSPESEIEVSLGTDTIGQIILITLLLAALSGVIGVAFITQYEPLKILRERN